MKDRLVVGFVEKVTLENGRIVSAKIDTGADSSSIDKDLVKELGDKKMCFL